MRIEAEHDLGVITDTASDDCFQQIIYLLPKMQSSYINMTKNIKSNYSGGEVRLPVKAIHTPNSFVSIAIKMTFPDKWQSLVDDEHLYERHYGFNRLCGNIHKVFGDEKEDKNIILV